MTIWDIRVYLSPAIHTIRMPPPFLAVSFPLPTRCARARAQRTSTPALRRRLIVTTNASAPTVPRRRGPVPPPRRLDASTAQLHPGATLPQAPPPLRPAPNPNGDAVTCRRFVSPAVYAPTSTSTGEGHFHHDPQACRMEPAALESEKSEVSRSGQHLPVPNSQED